MKSTSLLFLAVPFLTLNSATASDTTPLQENTESQVLADSSSALFAEPDLGQWDAKKRKKVKKKKSGGSY